MKKLRTTLLLFVALPMGLFAQSGKNADGSSADRFGLMSPLKALSSIASDADDTRLGEFAQERAGGPIWQETFNNGMNTAGDTIYTDNGGWLRGIGDGAIWKHSFTHTNGCWSDNTPALAFSSVANGFLMFDADSANCVDPNSNPPAFNQDILFGSIESPDIDLSANPAVALEFDYATRWGCADQFITVALSDDGGTTWSDEITVISPDANTNLQEVFLQNVSNLIGGSATARIKFTWSAASHYYLAIDDVKLVLPPADDMNINYAFVSHNGTSEEYGRIPLDQLQSEITVGAEAYNFGSTSQDNIALAVDFETGGNSAFTGSDSEATLVSLDTVILEDMPSLPAMVEGLYTGEFIVTSDNDTALGANFDNNTLSRNFLVTDNIYSIDGIGVHDEVETSTMGTASFTGAEDGFMMLAYYDISTETGAIGLEIVLGSDTEAGSALMVTLHDTADVYLDDVTLRLAESDIYDITQADANNGTIQVMFTDPIILSPNAYYAGVEMFSNTGDKLVEIVDDITIPQPFYSSMIYVPDDAVYSNGNAAAIRLITADDIGIRDASKLEGISIYPNPTKNMIRIEMDIPDTYDIEVSNVLGEVVYTSSVSSNTSIEMNQFGSGVYVVNVSTSSAFYSERVVVH